MPVAHTAVLERGGVLRREEALREDEREGHRERKGKEGRDGAGMVRHSKGAEGERLDYEDHTSAQQPVVELERASVPHVRSFSPWEASFLVPLRPEI